MLIFFFHLIQNKEEESMANIFSYCRWLFAYRKHERFTVHSNTFVILSPGKDKEQKARIIDISLGGVAFVYEGSKEDLESSGILKMIGKNANLEKLNFETVSDRSAHGFYRRRGVKFNWMVLWVNGELRDFIKKVSI